jgi:hypothetical protein
MRNIQTRRIREAVGGIHAARDEIGELEALRRPDPVRKTVEPLSVGAGHAAKLVNVMSALRPVF